MKTLAGATKQKRMHWTGVALAITVLLLIYTVFLQPKPAQHAERATTAHPQRVSAVANGPSFEGCAAFPADNVWNARVDKLPVSTQSATYADTIGPLHSVHPDFGAVSTNGIPITLVPAGTAGVSVPFDYADDSDVLPYPIPVDARVEGGPAGEGDRHIVLVDAQNCVLYEIFAAERRGSGWKAGSGMVMDLTSNALRAEHKTSADAAGLPVFPGLVRYDEVSAGEIRHALRFTLPQTQASYVWPARHFASKLVSSNYPPMGQRFRLRATFDEKRFRTPQARVIATALKQYGMILADNGGALYISGVPDPRWSDDDLHKLSQIKAEDFEAVDESSLRLLPDSGRVKVSGAVR